MNCDRMPPLLLLFETEFRTTLAKFASELRLLPESESLVIPFPIDVLGVEPDQIIVPKEFGKDHAHFEVSETKFAVSFLSSSASHRYDRNDHY